MVLLLLIYLVSNEVLGISPMKNDAMEKRLPQAIIIGAKKAGTRALLEYLRLHPMIKGPGPETHFFDKNYHLGLEWYRWVYCNIILFDITMKMFSKVYTCFPSFKQLTSDQSPLFIHKRYPRPKAYCCFTGIKLAEHVLPLIIYRKFETST